MNELMLFDEPMVSAHGNDRLLVLIFPPSHVARELSDFAMELREGRSLIGSPRPVGHLHITLSHLGDFAGLRDEIVAAARRLCAAAAARSGNFPLQLDRVSCRGKRRKKPLVFYPGQRNAALIRLYERLVIEGDKEGLRDLRREFDPHLTSAYVERDLPAESMDPVSWLAEEIVLIHSRVGRTQYIELGRWKLGA